MKAFAKPFSVVLLSLIAVSQTHAKDAVDEEKLTAEANQIVQQFAGQLKPKLKAAIQSGGLVHAIDVCSVEAPKIAKQMSADTGWSVKRVSLKARNQSSAIPDAFEKKVLESFDARLKAGESAAELQYSALADGEFRYLRAQPVEAVCLNCHGVTLQDNVKQALAKHYPEDSATGYSLGDIRGAFSLSRIIAD